MNKYKIQAIAVPFIMLMGGFCLGASFQSNEDNQRVLENVAGDIAVKTLVLSNVEAAHTAVHEYATPMAQTEIQKAILSGLVKLQVPTSNRNFFEVAILGPDPRLARAVRAELYESAFRLRAEVSTK